MLTRIRHDLIYALRRARHSPGFTAVVVLTLALGIGASAAVFTFLDAAILKALPYESPNDLVSVTEASPERGFTQFPVSPVNLADWQARSRELDFAAAASRRFILSTSGDPERLAGASVSTNYFSLLGIRPALGRGFIRDDSTVSAGRVAVLSYGTWRNRFASDPSIVGKAVTLSGTPFKVVGVMGPGLPNKSDLWVPMTQTPDIMADRSFHFLSVIARIRPGRSAVTAERELKTIAAQLAVEYPASNKNWTINTVPVLDQMLGNTKPALLALMIAVLFVLLIASANVANLLLARGMAREGEIAVRTAMGAERIDLIRQLLVESLVLASASAVLGIGVAWAGVSVLRAMAPTTLPRLDQVSLDVRFVLFTIGLTIVTAALFGIPPALHASMTNLAQRLRGGGRSITGRGGRIQRVLVVTQIAFALMLLTGSALLLRAFVGLRTQDLGVVTSNVLSAQIILPRAAFPRDVEQSRFFTDLTDRLRAVPGVTGVSAVDTPPVGGMPMLLFTIDGRPVPDPTNHPVAISLIAAPGYFGTLSIPLKQGRDFAASDGTAAPPVIVIDELLARRFFPGENPIGKRLVLGEPPAREIIGVVGHVRQAGPDSKETPTMYTPMTQQPVAQMAVLVRSRLDARVLTDAVRREVRALSTAVPVYDIQTLDQRIETVTASAKFNATVAGIFAVAALFLAAIGVYSVLAFAVAQQTREIGVRTALGAPRSALMASVMRQGATLALIGVIVGVGLSLGATRGLQRFVTGVGTIEPAILAGTSALFMVIALVAALVPAYRATRVDPLTALRGE